MPHQPTTYTVTWNDDTPDSPSPWFLTLDVPHGANVDQAIRAGIQRVVGRDHAPSYTIVDDSPIPGSFYDALYRNGWHPVSDVPVLRMRPRARNTYRIPPLPQPDTTNTDPHPSAARYIG